MGLKNHNKKAMDLPINIVVMMIIGIILFALGMSIFTKMSKSGDDQIEELNNKIKNDISSLECPGDDWICSPSNKLKLGESKVFQVMVANKGDEINTFKVNFPNLIDLDDGKKGIHKDSCGDLILIQPNLETNILSGNSGSFPFKVIATRVKKTPCSFVTTAELLDGSGNIIGKTAVILRVE